MAPLAAARTPSEVKIMARANDIGGGVVGTLGEQRLCMSFTSFRSFGWRSLTLPSPREVQCGTPGHNPVQMKLVGNVVLCNTMNVLQGRISQAYEHYA